MDSNSRSPVSGDTPQRPRIASPGIISAKFRLALRTKGFDPFAEILRASPESHRFLAKVPAPRRRDTPLPAAGTRRCLGIPVGALAQKITGELGLRYEEIPCDDTLPQKLIDTNKDNVPTVLFVDPESLDLERFARSLEDYDAQYLLNCAVLVAWKPEKKDAIDADALWARLKNLQKVKNPPPFHEWRSIFSYDELDRKTHTLIEQIRARLLKNFLSDPDKAASWAESVDPTLATLPQRPSRSLM
jgi:hypothetical protein